MAELEDLPVQESGREKPLFETVNMLDPRLVVQDSIMFGVEKSGQSVNTYIQPASSANSSGCQFSVVVPSLSTVISRKVLIKSQIQFQVAISCEAIGVPAAGNTIGTALKNGNFCLAPFAFHQLCSNITCTINNASFTFDCQNQLNEVLRCLDKHTLKQFNTYTPCQLDSYANYSDVTQFSNTYVAGNNANWNYILDSPFRSYGGADALRPRGSYSVVVNNAGSNAVVSGGAGFAGGVVNATITVNVIEPLIMSPFLLSSFKNVNAGGLYGIQNMDFNFQFRSDALRAIRAVVPTSGGTQPVVSILNVSIPNTQLVFEYLTPQPDLKLPSRNIVPYYQLQTFKTELGGFDPATAPVPYSFNYTGNVTTQGAGISPSSTPINSQNYQLSSIPDSVMMCVRKIGSKKYINDSDTYLVIGKPGGAAGSVNINFNNSPGICSNFTQEQLYEMSQESGVNMNWLEWSGIAQINTSATSTYTAGTTSVSSTNGGRQDILTAGSLLKLDFGKHINIAQSYYAPGSIGQFSFSVSLNVLNYGPQINTGTYELVCIFMYSGMIVSSLGTTASYTGLLTKENVMEAATKPVINKGQYDRIYGGGWFSNLKSGIAKAAKYVKPVARLAKQGLAMSNDPRAQNASRMLGQMGAGYSGAGQSAGGKFSNRLY